MQILWRGSDGNRNPTDSSIGIDDLRMHQNNIIWALAQDRRSRHTPPEFDCPCIQVRREFRFWKYSNLESSSFSDLEKIEFRSTRSCGRCQRVQREPRFFLRSLNRRMICRCSVAHKVDQTEPLTPVRSSIVIDTFVQHLLDIIGYLGGLCTT